VAPGTDKGSKYPVKNQKGENATSDPLNRGKPLTVSTMVDTKSNGALKSRSVPTVISELRCGVGEKIKGAPRGHVV